VFRAPTPGIGFESDWVTSLGDKCPRIDQVAHHSSPANRNSGLSENQFHPGPGPHRVNLARPNTEEVEIVANMCFSLLLVLIGRG
jgi:hypothetical protein